MRNKVDKQTGIPRHIINDPKFIDGVLTHYGELWRYHLSTVDKWVICWAKANADLENVNIFKESILCNVYQRVNDFMIKLNLSDFDINCHYLYTIDKLYDSTQHREEPIYDEINSETNWYVSSLQSDVELPIFQKDSIVVGRFNKKKE